MLSEGFKTNKARNESMLVNDMNTKFQKCNQDFIAVLRELYDASLHTPDTVLYAYIVIG